MNTNIIAIDPGTTKSAIVRWDGSRITCADIQQNEGIAVGLDCSFNPQTDLLCIEMVASYGMAVGKEVFETVRWIGHFERIWLYRRPTVPSRLIYRRDVKLHHCGSARAKDANIRQALIDKYGAPGTKKSPGATYGLKSHLWSAFAIAAYVAETAKDGVSVGEVGVE